MIKTKTNPTTIPIIIGTMSLLGGVGITEYSTSNSVSVSPMFGRAVNIEPVELGA